MTASEVTSLLTTCAPVSGRLQRFRIFLSPRFDTWSMTMRTRLAPLTRSIAPPGPLTMAPGIIQFARSPSRETCIAPRMARSIWPPRIIAKLCALLKKLAPGTVVTVSFPALIRSASSSSSVG